MGKLQLIQADKTYGKEQVEHHLSAYARNSDFFYTKRSQDTLQNILHKIMAMPTSADKEGHYTDVKMIEIVTPVIPGVAAHEKDKSLDEKLNKRNNTKETAPQKMWEQHFILQYRSNPDLFENYLTINHTGKEPARSEILYDGIPELCYRDTIQKVIDARLTPKDLKNLEEPEKSIAMDARLWMLVYGMALETSRNFNIHLSRNKQRHNMYSLSGRNIRFEKSEIEKIIHHAKKIFNLGYFEEGKKHKKQKRRIQLEFEKHQYLF